MPPADLAVQPGASSAIDVLEGVTDYVMLLDHDWTITYLNAAARRLLAHETQILGRNLWKMFPKADRKHIRGRMEAAVALGQPARFQVYGPDLENWYDLSLRPLAGGVEIAFHEISPPGTEGSAPPAAADPAVAPPGEMLQMSWLQKELSRLADQIGQVSSRLVTGSPGAEALEWSDQRLARLAEEIYRDRRMRRQFFADVELGEPQWDMLLDLFVQTVAGRPVSVKSACIASDVPESTALRWLRELIAGGLVEQTVDTLDKRRKWVALSPAGMKAMATYLKATALARAG